MPEQKRKSKTISISLPVELFNSLQDLKNRLEKESGLKVPMSSLITSMIIGTLIETKKEAEKAQESKEEIN